MSLKIELSMQRYQSHIVGLLFPPVTFILGNCLGLTEYSQCYDQRKVRKITVGYNNDERCMKCHCYWHSSRYKLKALFQVTVRRLLHSWLSDIGHGPGQSLIFCLDNLECKGVPEHSKLSRQIGVNADCWSWTEIVHLLVIPLPSRTSGRRYSVLLQKFLSFFLCTFFVFLSP